MGIQTKVKGAVLRARLALVDDLAPKDGRVRVLARLSAAQREELVSVLATAWYSFDLAHDLDESIVAELGGGDLGFFERLGAASAEKNLGPGGVHARFLKVGEPQDFLARAPAIYAFYYSSGRREYTRVHAKEAVLTTFDADTFSVADCATVVGWHRRALEMCGAVGVKVVEERCRARGDTVCSYRMSWR